MRNLKRALSLTLASVMLLGMMVVGAGAAGFPDVDENDNVEAIEVLNAVDVILGYDNGDFGPDDLVTRAQMAVIMAKLLNLDYQYYEATCPFTDVPEWARGYVGACYARGITSGYSATTYGPNDGITPVQAASMMMRALGYFQYSEDYKAGFEVATVSKGTDVGIFKGVGSSATAQMTRNQVAKMALNALCSEMVTFTGTPGMEINGVVVGYRPEYTPRTSTETKYQAIERRTSDVSGGNNLNRGQYYVQLGEELYDGKLVRRSDRDDFMRPSINWQYDGKEIGTYVDYSLLVTGGTYVDGVKYSELYNLLTYSTIRDNDLDRYVDGVDQSQSKDDFNRSNSSKVGGRGVLTEVFFDQDKNEITITSINTYLAKANSDYNKSNETLSLKVYTGRNGNAVTSTTKIVDSAIVPEAENVSKDDYRLVYMSGKENASNYEVVQMFDTEIIPEASITKWAKSTSQVVGDFTANGTEYKTNVKGFYDAGNVLDEYGIELLTDMSYNIYLDRYGNAIGVDLAEGTKNYVFITGYDRMGSNIAVRTAEAAAIFMDGTMDVIKVNVTDTNKNIEKSKNGQFETWKAWDNLADKGLDGKRNENRWYTYTVSNSGVYTLKPVERFFWTDYDLTGINEKVLNTANLFVDDSKRVEGLDHKYAESVAADYQNQGRAYGNDNSVYITVDADRVDTSTIDKNAITDVKGVYTGAQNVKLEMTKSTKYDVEEAYIYSIYDSNYYIIASVVLGEAQGAAANYAYILGDAKNEEIRYETSADRASGDATYYWQFDAVVNGEKTTLTAKTKYSSVFSGLEKFHVQELRFDGDYVTKIVDVKPEKVMTEIDLPLTDKVDVYDMGHVTAANATNKKTDTSNEPSNGHGDSQYAHSSHRIDGTIELVGRTLYTERVKNGSNKYDVGLALTADAKAVLIQYENNERVVTNCSSVSEAVGRLADAEPDETYYPGTQFRGRIVAVLENSAARWVVIISDTPVSSSKPGYSTNGILEWSQSEQAWRLYIPSSEIKSWEQNGTSVVYSYLVKAGCSEITKTRDGWSFSFKGVYNENQEVNIHWIYDDEVINGANPTVPTVTTLADGANLPTASAENGANYTVSITWTKDGAAYNDTKVNGAGTYAWTVTLTAKNGYTFANGVKTVYTGTITVDDDTPSGGHWEWDNEAGGPVWVPDAAPASMARFARAARAGGNGSPFDEYIGQYIRISLENIGLDKVYTVYVTTTASGATTLKFGADIDDAGKKEIIDKMNASGLGQLALQPKYQAAATEEQIDAWKGNGENPPADTSSITAKVEIDPTSNDKLTVTFEEYRADHTKVEKLTKAQIAAALNASDYGKRHSWSFTADDIDLTSGSEAVVGRADIDIATDLGTNSGTATQVYEVTYPGPDGKDVTVRVDSSGLAAGAKVADDVVALMDKNAVPATSAAKAVSAATHMTTDALVPATNPDSAKAGQASMMDVTYVRAVTLPNVANTTPEKDGIGTNGKIGIDVGGTNTEVLVPNYIAKNGQYAAIAKGADIQVGTKVYLTATAAADITALKTNAANQSVEISINGDKVVAVPVDKDGKIPTGDEAPFFEVPNGYLDGKTTLVVNAAVKPTEAKIFVDDKLLTDADKLNGTDYTIPNMTGYVLAYQDEDGVWTKTTGFTAADGTGNAIQAVGTGATPDEKGEIHLVRAWTVDGADNKTAASATWATYSYWDTKNDPLNPSKPIQQTDGTLAQAYYPASGENQYIWVQASAAGVILVNKDGSKLEKVVGVTAVDNSADAGKVQGVWKVPVTGNITDGSFIKLVELGDADARTTAIGADVAAKGATAWLSVAGITLDKTYGKDVTYTVTWKAADDYKDKVTLAAHQKVLNAGKSEMEFQIKLVSEEALTFDGNGTETDIGVLTLVITTPDGNVVETPVTVTMKI